MVFGFGIIDATNSLNKAVSISFGKRSLAKVGSRENKR